MESLPGHSLGASDNFETRQFGEWIYAGLSELTRRIGGVVKSTEFADDNSEMDFAGIPRFPIARGEFLNRVRRGRC
jgi:hypothetical protein